MSVTPPQAIVTFPHARLGIDAKTALLFMQTEAAADELERMLTTVQRHPDWFAVTEAPQTCDWIA